MTLLAGGEINNAALESYGRDVEGRRKKSDRCEWNEVRYKLGLI